MAQSIAVESLLKERDKIIAEKKAMNDRFTFQINELDAAIEKLSGKTVWQTAQEYTFDDESIHYVKSSEEEI